MTNNVNARLDKIEKALGFNKGGTNIHLILDMSGSMSTIGQKEVLGSANKYIREVKKSTPNATIEVVVFDTAYEQVIAPTPVSTVRKLTEQDYKPRGMTALYDAMGKTAGAAKTGRNLFVVLTDGQENSSHEFNAESLKSLIKKREKAGDSFLFLGANQDVILEAGKIGIRPQWTFNYVGTASGYAGASGIASAATSDWASGKDVDLQNNNTVSPN